jgi:hypothetical protein
VKLGGYGMFTSITGYMGLNVDIGSEVWGDVNRTHHISPSTSTLSLMHPVIPSKN